MDMGSLKYLLSLVLLACAAVSMCGGAELDVHEGAKACARSKSSPLAEPRFDGPLSDSQLAFCDSTALYYGFDAKPNYAAALQCAWYERAHTAIGSVDMFRGPGVLAMLYANGRGVEKDIDLAVRFSCEQPDPSLMELAERLHHLERMRNEVPAPAFDLCDDITSGLSGGFCAGIQEKFAASRRDVAVAQIRATLTPSQRALLDEVYAAEQAFASARSGEIDTSGTLRIAFLSRDRTRILDQFLIDLQRFSVGNVPADTPNGVKRLDAQMNALYQNVMRAPAEAFSRYGSIQQADVKAAQQAWLAAADAWMACASAAFPKVTAEQVRAQLLRERINQLRRLPVSLK